MLDSIIIGCSAVVILMLFANAMLYIAHLVLLKRLKSDAERVTALDHRIDRFQRALVCTEIFVQYGAKAFGEEKEEEARALLGLIKRIRNKYE